MYTVIGPTQTRTFRVLWMLEELGQPYEHLPHPPRSAEVNALNPTGKVPVLVSDGVALTDSTAIMTWLADRHVALTNPCGTVERAQQDAVTHWLLDEMDAILWTAARHTFVLPEAQRMPAIKPSLRWEFERSCKALSARLGDAPFLMGDAISLPDIVAVHCLSWARAAKFPTDDPTLVDYVRRLRARPAHRRAQERG